MSGIPDRVQWVTFRGMEALVRRLNYKRLKVRLAIPLPAERYSSGQKHPLKPENHTVMPMVAQAERPPYWPTLDDCLGDLRTLDAALRRNGKRAIIHIWLPIKDAPQQQGLPLFTGHNTGL